MQARTVPRGMIVADDSMAIRDNVRVALGDTWRIFLARDGFEALEYARGVKAELVMLDFRMPGLNGIDTCAHLRNLPHYTSVPIVLLTAYDSVELRRHAETVRITAVFPKPFSANALRDGVLPLIALGRDAAGRRGAETPAALPQPTAADGGDLAAGRDMLAVYRQVEAATKQRRHHGFVETMAAQRALSRP